MDERRFSQEAIELARKKLREWYFRAARSRWFLEDLEDALTVYEKLRDWKMIKEHYEKKVVDTLEWCLEDAEKWCNAVSTRV